MQGCIEQHVLVSEGSSGSSGVSVAVVDRVGGRIEGKRITLSAIAAQDMPTSRTMG